MNKRPLPDIIHLMPVDLWLHAELRRMKWSPNEFNRTALTGTHHIRWSIYEVTLR